MRVIQLHPGYDGPDDLVRNLRFRPDGRVVAALIGPIGLGHTVLRYDLTKDTEVHVDGNAEDDEDFEWAPDPAVDSTLELVARIAADEEGNHAVRLTDTWAKPPEETLLDWRSKGRSVMALGFSPAGILFVGGSVPPRGAAIARWDAEAIFKGAEPEDAELEQLKLPADFLPSAFAFARDGFGLVVGTFNGFMLFVDLRRPKEWQSLRHTPERSQGNPIYAMEFSPDGRRFVSRDRTTLTAWDMEKRHQLLHLTPPTPITDAAFSPDGRTLAAASANGQVTLYDTDVFAVHTKFDWKQGPLHSVAFAPDGLTAAAGGTGGRLILWDL